MSTAPTLDTALALMGELRASIAANRADLSRLETRLEELLKIALQGGCAGCFDIPICSTPPTAHRSAHRPGVQSKLDADPELRAFVLSRIDRLTFAQIADEVQKHFPPERRVGRSALHAWWQKRAKPPAPHSDKSDFIPASPISNHRLQPKN